MSHENHPDGFLRFPRIPIANRSPKERVRDHREIYNPVWDEARLRQQATRCMDCGVPTCMTGCPIGNMIPDWNDLVSRGDWHAALVRLHATNNFPEFTGYACPAPCEDGCTLAFNAEPVTIKNIERAIVDRGWDAGWIVPEPPEKRSRFRVAVVGSGPAGLAAAQQLNRAGHRVVVYERDDAPGGLVRYGIPEFKFSRHKLDRRLAQLTAEGIEFVTSVEIGRDIALDRLREDFDAVCLTLGAQFPRDVAIPGRHLNGIHFALPFLVRENRRQACLPFDVGPDAAGKKVVVLGGGDTGADCVATALRQGAEQVVQISINERPAASRPANNPWPLYLRTYRRSYALEEGGSERFGLNSLAFEDQDADGAVDHLLLEGVRWERDGAGRRVGKEVLQSGLSLSVDMVLIAIGFSRPQTDVLNAAGLRLEPSGTITTDKRMMTSLRGVFASGDARMGHSLLVWAIGEGRDLARQVDIYLTGNSRLPAGLRTRHKPVQGEGSAWSVLGF